MHRLGRTCSLTRADLVPVPARSRCVQLAGHGEGRHADSVGCIGVTGGNGPPHKRLTPTLCLIPTRHSGPLVAQEQAVAPAVRSPARGVGWLQCAVHSGGGWRAGSLGLHCPPHSAHLPWLARSGPGSGSVVDCRWLAGCTLAAGSLSLSLARSLAGCLPVHAIIHRHLFIHLSAFKTSVKNGCKSLGLLDMYAARGGGMGGIGMG